MFTACLALIAALALPVAPGSNNAPAAKVWETLPPYARLPPARSHGRVRHEGAQIFYAVYGAGPTVILLHGTLGNGGQFGNQVPALLASGHRVLLIDNRGQGRSTRDARPYSYALMESDVIAVMDALGIDKAAVVGWSDGAIIGLVMAMKNPERLTRLFAFGANMDPSGLRSDWVSLPIVAATGRIARTEYRRLSQTPNDFDVVQNAMVGASGMYPADPNYSAHDLAGIRGPAIAIVDGDHDEFMKRDHTEYMARTIPGAKLIILPGVSHFAPWQDPGQFNKAMIDFLDGHQFGTHRSTR